MWGTGAGSGCRRMRCRDVRFDLGFGSRCVPFSSKRRCSCLSCLALPLGRWALQYAAPHVCLGAAADEAMGCRCKAYSCGGWCGTLVLVAVARLCGRWGRVVGCRCTTCAGRDEAPSWQVVCGQRIEQRARLSRRAACNPWSVFLRSPCLRYGLQPARGGRDHVTQML